ncbi:zinc-binding dehydrogenase [Streptomyces sp. NBC_00490]|uniref:zinc-binding dehydrogenase n=1 Tax=Streptomyces sp. NBC_00490 TaxID=2903657 RepID=UPI0030E01375
MTVSTDEEAELARSVGAHEVVGVGGSLDKFRTLMSGRGVGLVVDPVGGDRFPGSLRALRHGGGRLLVLGFAGRDIPTVKVNPGWTRPSRPSSPWSRRRSR